jgi:hypothetical protein
MSELRNIPNVAYGAEATNPAHKGISDSIKAAAIIKIADDDAAAAVIRHAHRAEISNVQQKIDYNNLGSASVQAKIQPKPLLSGTYHFIRRPEQA